MRKPKVVCDCDWLNATNDVIDSGGGFAVALLLLLLLLLVFIISLFISLVVVVVCFCLFVCFFRMGGGGWGGGRFLPYCLYVKCRILLQNLQRKMLVHFSVKSEQAS